MDWAGVEALGDDGRRERGQWYQIPKERPNLGK